MDTTYTSRKVTVLAGGVGAAKFLRGLVTVVDPANITAIINVADDFVLHGLKICPDIDTVTYTLAGEVNPETGWGLKDETWQAMDMVRRYGGESWFGLGDRDLGTHLYRTQRLAQGSTLAEVTADVAAAWGLTLRMIPVTNDTVQTRVDLPDGSTIGFQDYFVGRRHDVTISGVAFVGASNSTPAPGVMSAITSSDVIIVAPSNPLVSIDPILSVPGIRHALVGARDRCVAISPIVGGRALKGPAARMLAELGHKATALGVAEIYAPIASSLVIDTVDASLSTPISQTGLRPIVTDTIMSSTEAAARLARTAIDAALTEPRV